MVTNLRDQRMLALAQMSLRATAATTLRPMYTNPDPGTSRLVGRAVAVNMNVEAADAPESLPFDAAFYVEVGIFCMLTCELTASIIYGVCSFKSTWPRT